jgi:hypothetical protein
VETDRGPATLLIAIYRPTLAEARKFSSVVTAANHASWMEREVIAYSSTPTVSVSMV